MEKKKRISVSIAPELNEPKVYRNFLVHSEEDALRIDLAERTETEDQIEITVKESIAIHADEMLKFALDILNELIEYENKYKNQKGLSIPEK